MKKAIIFFCMIISVFTACGKKEETSEPITLTNHMTESELEKTSIHKLTLLDEQNETEHTVSIETYTIDDKLRQLEDIKDDLTISMHDYGNFEKVGSIDKNLPQNNKQITTVPDDVILYQGNSITVYYDKNSWNFTRLGKIENVTKGELLDVLGKGDVEITFSLK